MTCPISWPRSASMLVSAAVRAKNELIVAPSPWNALMSSVDKALI